MVVIRLARRGAKKRPFYDIVVADSRRARDGRIIEKIGYFNPIASGQETPLVLDLDRAKYWINVGAQPSDRVKGLIKNHKKSTESAA
ncbi:MAG: 30S ribosomal protein S16 [Pseudomonadota bacterium]